MTARAVRPGHAREWRTAAVLLLSVLASPALAQQPQEEPPPPPGWTGSFGAGLAVTQGNSDTSTVNLAYALEFDGGEASVVGFKSAGLFIRGESEGELTTNRLAFEGRVERKLAERTSVFAQTQYLRDEFKEIDYLVSPTLGVSHFLVKTDATELAVDGGVGYVWEQNPGRPQSTSGALTAGQNFKLKLSETAEITQRASALWKMKDFDDALYVAGVGLSANITTRTQIKAEVLDTYKNLTPGPAVQKNDVAVLLSFVYKF